MSKFTFSFWNSWPTFLPSFPPTHGSAQSTSYCLPPFFLYKLVSFFFFCSSWTLFSLAFPLDVTPLSLSPIGHWCSPVQNSLDSRWFLSCFFRDVIRLPFGVQAWTNIGTSLCFFIPSRYTERSPPPAGFYTYGYSSFFFLKWIRSVFFSMGPPVTPLAPYT